jgi:restriction system protein
MSVSTVPLHPAFFHAVLTVLASYPQGVRRRDIHEPVADAMQLTAEQRAERLPSQAHLRFRHRIGWSLHDLKAAGYLESPAVGTWRLTARGSELLAAHPQKFDDDIIRRISREARAASITTDEAGERGPDTPDMGAVATQQTPEERIEIAAREIKDAVAGELLQLIGQSSPSFFEELVLDLLLALGYGATSADIQHVGGSGDGGVDGIISLDRLGFEKVYVQAKRWQGSVGRPEVQAFYGALAGRRAKKGVLITTSTFTRDAQEFAGHVSDSIVLIDGKRLTELLIDHGVAVTHYREIRLPRVDRDYFESE